MKKVLAFLGLSILILYVFSQDELRLSLPKEAENPFLYSTQERQDLRRVYKKAIDEAQESIHNDYQTH